MKSLFIEICPILRCLSGCFDTWLAPGFLWKELDNGLFLWYHIFSSYERRKQ